MFRKKSNGTVGRYRNYSSSVPYTPVRTSYRTRNISLFPVLSIVSGIAVCALVILFVRSCSCDTRVSENPVKKTETQTIHAPIETEKNIPVQKKKVRYTQTPAMSAPVSAGTEAKSVKEQPVEPFIPKTIDMGTHVEIITSPKK